MDRPKRSILLTFRVDPKLKAHIDKTARDAGKTVADLLRSFFLDEKDLELLFEKNKALLAQTEDMQLGIEQSMRLLLRQKKLEMDIRSEMKISKNVTKTLKEIRQAVQKGARTA
jgi:antitoxin component of RelBE/YafQ-DinJ toxin-antitoxin module